MKKVIYTYGLISGSIVALLMFATIPLWNGEMLKSDYGHLVGYTTMVVALSMVFFGIKSYRDNYAGGTITFGTGLKIGLLIALIAAIMYGLAWEITYRFMLTDFDTLMATAYREKFEKAGATPDEIALQMKEMDAFFEMYKNPLIRFGVTLFEILPVGVVISLLAAALLRKKSFMPATTTVEATPDNELTRFTKS